MKTFQEIIMGLQQYWASNGCAILHSFDMEVGAGTLSPHTALRVLDTNPWNVCYVQYSRRPTDARFAQNPNRLGAYYQMQVILKPAPDNIQELCTKSLQAIGIDTQQHDVRYIEDNWKNDSIGASGLGFEVWCDGMEIMQYTYMQKMGGIECQSTACEITYGLERVAMYVQNKENIFDINWGNNIKYSDIHKKDYEIEQSEYLQNYQEDTGALQAEFLRLNNNVALLIEKNLIIVAYEQCLKASHLLNILDARQAISYNQRLEYILLIRENVARCCTRWLLKYNN